MKNTDDNLRDVLRNKLHDYESPVPDALWQNVASQLPNPKTGSTGIGLTKIAAALVVGAAIVGGVINLHTSPSDNAQRTTVAPVETITTDTAAVKPIDKSALTEPTTNKETNIPMASASSLQPMVQGETLSEVSNTLLEAAPSSISAKPGVEVKSAPLDEEYYSQPRTETPAKTTDAQFSSIETDKSGLSFFFIPQHTGASHYAWSFGDGETSTELSPIHQFAEPGDYTVELKIEDAGATKFFRQIVSAIPAAILEVPSIFTPNADGKNDTFDVMALSRFILLESVRVFNASGSMVFESDGNNPWNGEDNYGNPLPDGNYIYTLKAKDLRQQPVEKSGTVYLRR